MVARQLPKLKTRVRFPSPAPRYSSYVVVHFGGNMATWCKSFYIVAVAAVMAHFPCFTASADDFNTLYNTIVQLDWEHSGDAEERRMYQNVVNLKNNLDKNTQMLQKNYQDVKANEQSLANRTLGAVSMAATGIGGMMLASALSEQNVDEQYEQDMQAYISSMRCEYANGKLARHGEMDVELPGGNELFNTYNEYITLANDIKERKNILGLKPGIESEVIMDNTALYNVESDGGANGTFASLYRAITDSTSEDAKQLADQKSKTASNLETGKVAALAGVAIGIIGNQIINGNAPTDKSTQLMQERNTIMNDIQSILNAKIAFCNNQVARARELTQTIESNPDLADDPVLQEFINAARNAQTISNATELGSNPLCPK